MNVKLLTERHLEFLTLKEGCTGSSESTLVKMAHCWKSHVAAHMSYPVLSYSQYSGKITFTAWRSRERSGSVVECLTQD